MKKVIAVVLVMCLIFGVTYITQFTGTDDKPKDDKNESGVGPLLWGAQTAKRDATSSEPHYRYFPGFYEVNVENSVLFWFRNEKPVEVTLGFSGVSCARCTNARAAVIPPEALDQFLQWSMLPAALPVGFGAVPTFLPAIGAVELLPKLVWTDFGVDKVDLKVKVPAATPGRPVWGIVRIGFRATTLGPNHTAAFFNAHAAGAKVPTDYKFDINIMGVDSFDVTPKDFVVGELAEGASPAQFELLYWSVLRPRGDLAPPVVKVGNDDPFVAVDKPIAMTEEELEKFSAKLGQKHQELGVKVQSGYRIPVTVRREVAGKLPDIGLFEKEVFVTGPGDRVDKIGIKGRVTGFVWLQDAQQVDLKSYSGKLGTETRATVVAGKTDLELKLLPDETKPRFLHAALADPKTEPGRKTWTLKLSVPPQEGFSPHWTGSVVLETTGPNPQKVRIPVIGHGR